jgi:DNA-binding MarR family transcriptional regulator
MEMKEIDRFMPSEPTADGAEQSAYLTAQMLERLMTMTYAVGEARELRSSQWAALRFFAGAGPRERTVKAFAEYNSTSTASASQTVSTLVRRGLLSSAASRHDGRSKEVAVTEAGRRFLKRDPLRLLARTLESLAPRDKGGFDTMIAAAARQLERAAMEAEIDPARHGDGLARMAEGAGFGAPGD